LISSGVRTDKGFKEVHLNQVARDLHEFIRNEAHPKDAELLNKPIENYQQMEVIFGNGHATGKFAMGSSEPLGCPSDFAESTVKLEETKLFGETSKPQGTQEAAGGGSGSGNNKRKRCMISEEDMNAMSGMTAAVNNVADAIHSTKIEDSHPGLYDAVMFMPGFTEDALIVAYSHLLDNRAHGNAFVGMTDAHRVLWLRIFLAKHYYA
ncbi:hypothetical protein EJB05_23241, partial [Eragrostis curvula]